MPRSSRHKSHRSHKHSSRDAREPSDSEEEESSRGRRQRDDVSGSGSGGRTSRSSRDLDVERRKESSPLQGAAEGDGVALVNADLPAEHGKKRKERPLNLPGAADRWNGDDTTGFVEKEMKIEEFLDEDKMSKSRLSGSESKSRLSRRYENSTSDRKDESGVRDEPSKRRSEKDPITSNQFLDLKESDRECRGSRDRERLLDRDSGHDSVKDRARGLEKERDYRSEQDKEHRSDRDIERGSERDRKHASERNKELDMEERSRRDKESLPDVEHDRRSERDRGSDGRQGKPSDASNQNERVRHSEGHNVVKGDLENADVQILDDIVTPDIEKDLIKRIRRDGSSDKDKWQGDGMDIYDLARNDGYKVGKYKDHRYREKAGEDIDRDKSSRSNRYQDERSSKDHASDSSENKYYKNTNRPSENNNRNKSRDNNDRESSYMKEPSTRYRDNKGKKRSDQTDEYLDVKPQNPKESCSSIEKISVENFKLDSSDDKGRRESIHSNRSDSTPIRDRQRNSPASTVHVIHNEYRHSSKQAEATRRSISREKHHTSSASSGDLASVSGVTERMLDSHSVESAAKLKGANSGEMVEDASISHSERTPRSDGHASVIQLSEKSPVTSDRQNSSRRGVRRNLDIDEVGQKGSFSKGGREYSYKERERDLSAVKSYVDDGPQMQFPSSEITRSGSSSYIRADHISNSSPNQVPPTPPVRQGTDSISVLGSAEDDRVQGGDRKAYNCYRRSMEPNLSKGQGNAWNGVPNWPSPVPNGFIPFQHGPPGGFHPVPQQFPAPSMYGVRPFMDFNRGGVPFHMHDTPDRFSGHSRPFGWRNPSDDSCPPPLQGWEGNNGAYSNDPHMYGRSEWEQNRHLVNNQGWEMSGGHWKGQNGSSMEFSDFQKEAKFSPRPPVDEARVEQPGSQPRNEQFQLNPVDIKQPVHAPAKGNPDTRLKIRYDKSPEASESIDNGARFCSTYLSKLDISLDLAHPDLYKQCTKIIETEGEKVPGNKDASVRLVHAQDPNEGFKLAVRSCNQVGKPLFPTITDTVFMKAFSIYRKLSEGRDKEMPTITQSKEEHKYPETLDVQTLRETEKDSSGTSDVVKSECKDDFPETMEVEKGDPVEDESSEAMDVEEIRAIEVTGGDAMLIANRSGSLDEDSNNASDFGANSNNGSDLGGDLLATVQERQPEMIFAGDTSQGCEELMPECLSRIPNSPESTH